jgi:TPR repeat protein
MVYVIKKYAVLASMLSFLATDFSQASGSEEFDSDEDATLTLSAYSEASYEEDSREFYNSQEVARDENDDVRTPSAFFPQGFFKSLRPYIPKGPEHPLKAKYQFEADNGNPASALKLTCLLLQPQDKMPTEVMQKEAFEWLISLKEFKYPVAWFNLAHCLQYGNGVVASKTAQQTALKLYRMTDDRGYLPAKVAYAYCLYHGIGYKEITESSGNLTLINNLRRQTDIKESLSLFNDAACQGSQFSALHLGYHFLYSDEAKEDDLELAIFNLKLVDEEQVVAPMLAAAYLIQQDRSRALQFVLKADQHYKNWLSHIPISDSFIKYLTHRVAQESKKPNAAGKTNRKGQTRKALKAQKADPFKAKLAEDLKQAHPHYTGIRDWLHRLTHDEGFPEDEDFNPQECLDLVRKTYKSFQHQWTHESEDAMKSVHLSVFLTELYPFIEKCFISEQLVRNKQLKAVLARQLREQRLESKI